MRNGIEHYAQYLGPRFRTFTAAFEAFIVMGGRTIVELGTIRSFVPGHAEGCMSSDPRYWDPTDPSKWDWGAGFFTRICAQRLERYRPEIHTVDIDPKAMQVSRIASADFRHLITYHVSSSEEFLRSFPKKIDLLYMDSADLDEDAAKLHLREAVIAVSRGLFSDDAIVLVDDAAIQKGHTSKGMWSIAYLLGHGFELKMFEYQALLQRIAG
jgi:hypothetical protein